MYAHSRKLRKPNTFFFVIPKSLGASKSIKGPKENSQNHTWFTGYLFLMETDFGFKRLHYLGTVNFKH